jgi:hypothetical protein
MAVDIQIPVILPQSAADYITAYSTATAYLEYDAASTFDSSPGTATTALVSGTERYEFDVTGVTSAYWYRWRIGESDGSTFYDYAPTFQVPYTYASVQDLIRGMDFPDESREDELDLILRDATDFITTVICGGRSFFRNPVGAGTATLELDIPWDGNANYHLRADATWTSSA